MAKLVRIADFRQPQCSISFDREELNQLLALYSRRVTRGEWKDYAIDQGAGMAVFSVFRHADDRAVFAIAKIGEGSEVKARYLLFSGFRILRKSPTLQGIVATFDAPLKLVVSKA